MLLFFIDNSLFNVYLIYDSCIYLLDAIKNTDGSSNHIPPASDYQSNLNNGTQNREYDQQNDPDTLSRGQTRRRHSFDQQQPDNSDPLVNVISFSTIFHYGDWFWFSPYFNDIHIILYIQLHVPKIYCAMLLALKFVSDKSKFMICSDSLSCLLAFESCKTQNPFNSKKLLKFIKVLLLLANMKFSLYPIVLYLMLILSLLL
jgi:hypothetical protein